MKLYKLIEPSPTFFFIVLVFWANQVFSSDDKYLQALEAEANSGIVQAEEKTAASSKAGAVAPQNNIKKEFETRLLNELPATYKTYRLLEKQDKQKVVEVYYSSDKNMLITTRLLFDLYFKVK